MSTKTRKNSQTDKALTHFSTVDDCDNKTHRCNVENCGKYLMAKKPSNLVAHLKSCQKPIYNEISAQKYDDKYYLKKRLQFIQNCAELVAINGRPFHCLTDSGFLKFVEKDANELTEAGFGVNLQDKTEVKCYISKLADKIKSKIKCEAKGSFISVMVDIGSMNNRSLLGISVQYLAGGSIRVRCLGTIELKSSHTALYIKEVITNCLLMFDISIEQVISITTDNGSNMLAMIDLFNDDVYDENIPDLDNVDEPSQISGEDDADSVSVCPNRIFLFIGQLIQYLWHSYCGSQLCFIKIKIKIQNTLD